jgi:hypothetical protein
MSSNDSLTVLQSRGPLLTKQWSADGIRAYDRAKTFTVEAVPVASIHSLSAVLVDLQSKPRSCVIRGEPVHGIDAITTRDLDHFTEVPRRWVCLDVDNWVPTADPVRQPAEAVAEFITGCLPDEFYGISHHWQLSSSAGAPGKEGVLKAHIWFWLDAPRTGVELEAWARTLDLPVDVTVFRTVQVHYTAGPVIDQGVACPVAQRCGLVEGIFGDEVHLVLPDSSDYHARVRQVKEGRQSSVDPTTKPGLIGQFCRLYPPARVVDELLPDVFEWEGDSPARLTWLQGGGSIGGACITDDEQGIYNSHSTDPFEGRRANSWDVVRVHKFGELDAAIDPDAVPWLMSNGGLPSHRAMVEYALALEDVAAEREQAHQEQAQAKHEEDAAVVTQLEQRVHSALAQVAAATSPAELERVTCPALATQPWSQGEQARLVKAVQDRFAQLAQSRLPVATAREWLTPPRSASLGHGEGPEWLDDWVFVRTDNTFFHLGTKKSYSKTAFDVANSARMPYTTVNGVPTERHESATDYAINVWSIDQVDNTVYAPGMPRTFDLVGQTWANLYTEDSVPDAGPGGEVAIQMVQAHLTRLFPDDRERGILLSWMAHNVRHPGRKIRWAPYIFGAQGTGKTFIAELMGLVMGAANTRVLSGVTLQGHFNNWVVGSALVTVEEVYQSGHLYETEEKLKAPIANDTVDVHKKGKDNYSAPNFTNYLLLSNHPDGMPIGKGDRRLMILQTATTAEQAQALADEGYFSSLFDTCRSNVPGLRRWLLNEVDMHPEFDADGRAPGTAAKDLVIQLSKSDTEVAMDEMLAGRTVVTTSAISAMLEHQGIPGSKTRVISKILARLGFEFYKRMRVDGKPDNVYARVANTAGISDAAVREALKATSRSQFDDEE